MQKCANIVKGMQLIPVRGSWELTSERFLNRDKPLNDYKWLAITNYTVISKVCASSARVSDADYKPQYVFL